MQALRIRVYANAVSLKGLMFDVRSSYMVQALASYIRAIPKQIYSSI